MRRGAEALPLCLCRPPDGASGEGVSRSCFPPLPAAPMPERPVTRREVPGAVHGTRPPARCLETPPLPTRNPPQNRCAFLQQLVGHAPPARALIVTCYGPAS